MQTYETYKNSGIDWLGDIPSNWDVKPGFTILKERKERNKGMLSNNVLSLSYGKIIEKPIEKLTGLVPENFETYQLVYKGDIIFRPTDLQNDKVSLRTGLSNFDGIITSAYINLQPINSIPKFIHYYLHTTDTNKVIYGLGSGLRQNISFLDFKRFLFALPPITEQEAIAAFLDEKCGKIDKLVSVKEQQIALLKERRQIVIHEAVTKGIQPNVEMKDSGIDWIGEIPKHWEASKVKNYLAIPITDGPHTTPELIDKGIPFISAEAIKNGKIDFNKKRGNISQEDYNLFSLKYKPKKYDIYMIKSGATTGNIAMVETDEVFTIWSPLAVFRAGSKLLPSFLYNILESSYFKRGVELSWSFGTQQNIGMGVLSNLFICVPPISEQEAIVAYLEEQTDKIDQAIALKTQQIEQLKAYKQSLINEVVTGKVKVA